MRHGDLALRRVTYAMFVDLGRAPRAAEVAASTGTSVAEVLAGWRRLHDDHALVLTRTRVAAAHPRQNQAILHALGLTSPFWRLP